MSKPLKRLVVVRHGQSTANVNPDIVDESLVVLTELGIKQAEATGRYLRDCKIFNFTNVYSSDMIRAVETAAIIRRAMENSAPLRQIHDLREQDAPQSVVEKRKELEQMFLARVKLQFPTTDITKSVAQAIAFPEIQKKMEVEVGAESLESMQARLRLVLDRIARESEGDALIVSHSKLIDSLVHMFTGIYISIVRHSV
jgi:broad specificity phosphatase PhoE